VLAISLIPSSNSESGSLGVAQSVCDLVAEGGNVLASDDAPMVSGQTLLETAMLVIQGEQHRNFGWAKVHC
jgi:hypothetical protein